MINIAVFDTSQGTQNLGDYIIMDSINREMDFLFSENFVTKYSTHTPIARSYQNLRKGMILRVLDKAEYKFIGGTNIFKNTLFRFNPDWNINIFNTRFYKNSIAIGCGSALNAPKMDKYTEYIYKHILSKKHIHSTRDERTKRKLMDLGFDAINTGCPTLWGLDTVHCEQIPKEKSNRVVFTLTDYLIDRENDQLLIDILLKNYEEVYFWVQGAEDFEYYKTLNNIGKIKIIHPNLQDYAKVLDSGVDYIGTRLHAGIYALQHKCRSIILAIDERARDMDETYNLNCVERKEIQMSLPEINHSNIATDIHINEKAVNKWKDQFR